MKPHYSLMVRKSSLGLLALIFLMSLAFDPSLGSQTSEKDKPEKQPNWSKRYIPSPDTKWRFLVANMNGVVFTVPKDYVGQNPPNLPSFDVRVYWPGMVPVTHETQQSSESFDIITMLFRLNPERTYYTELADVLERDLKRNKFSEPTMSERYPGLVEYGRGPKNVFYRAKNPSLTTPAGKPLVLECTEFASTIGPEGWRCYTNLHFPKGVAVVYRFKRKHLADWKSIHTAVIRLIESFRGE